MRDEWYGDKRDLVKWGVLLHLADQFSSRSILQVPYYRPSEWRDLEIDGQRYPFPDAVVKHFRTIRDIRRLKARCRIQVVPTPFRNRTQYAAAVRRAIAAKRSGRSIVFLDPDTGLAPRNPGPEHVLGAELAAIWAQMSPGDVLVFYQHQTNRSGRPWVEEKRQQFAEALGLPPEAAGLVRAPEIARDVAFFFCEKKARAGVGAVPPSNQLERTRLAEAMGPRR